MRVKLNRPVEAALRATGLPWEIIQGTKHYRVMLAGRQVCVLSMGGKARANARSSNNKKDVTCIERLAAEIKGGKQRP